MEKNILIENLIKQLFTKKRKENIIDEICNVKFGG